MILWTFTASTAALMLAMGVFLHFFYVEGKVKNMISFNTKSFLAIFDIFTNLGING